MSLTSAGHQFVDEGVIVVTHIVEGVEGVPVVRRERNAFPDTQRQIWICHEVTSESEWQCKVLSPSSAGVQVQTCPL
jgi:hypothetical protein